MASRFPPRAADDALVLALALRRRGGLTLAAIARRLGTDSASLLNRMKRVVEADLAESGEPADAVRAAYPWWRGA